ncbi:MAG: 2-C-methyl-D-erythritol 4-phosphate cytidylyltransferase [Verrucomicrobia bacterium]|nr:2-C-methyl-D-erythritol 4-phosphate cytidylyltransferase [Verrucomicrobiota bacterium]
MNAAVIVAAGRGTRMGPDVDKLFLTLRGAPLVVHTWKRFAALDSVQQLVLVVRQGMESVFHELAAVHGLSRPYVLVCGGKERQDSVWNGLQALDPGIEVVGIHDGARPCVSPELIEETLAKARQIGAAVAAQRVTDTLKESTAPDSLLIARTVDRSRLWSVQTPQAFRVSILREALARVRSEGRLVTDDTAACEWIGQPVGLVESRTPNPKATTQADLPYLEWLLAREASR